MKKDKVRFGDEGDDMVYDRKAFGRRVQSCREAAGMTRYELAAAINVCVETVRLIETGKRDSRAETLCLLSECLDTPIGCLLYGEEATGEFDDEFQALIRSLNYRQQKDVVALAKMARSLLNVKW